MQMNHHEIQHGDECYVIMNSGSRFTAIYKEIGEEVFFNITEIDHNVPLHKVKAYAKLKFECETMVVECNLSPESIKAGIMAINHFGESYSDEWSPALDEVLCFLEKLRDNYK